MQVAELPAGDCGDLIVLRLYAALPLELQARVFVPPPEGCRRCVVATNIAETSITIDGVVYVVDGDMCKEKPFAPPTGAPPPPLTCLFLTLWLQGPLARPAFSRKTCGESRLFSRLLHANEGAHMATHFAAYICRLRRRSVAVA